ncbi:MAG: outer membrane lipoprotein-sorting protein [Desulfobacterales bacterium]|nr:MAG: outer membrane lipoprotein-sorting protein [Desulfobacterales bacterium]
MYIFRLQLITALTLAITFIHSPVFGKELTGHEIAMKMDAVDTSSDSVSRAVMSITRGKKQLTRSFITYSKVFDNGKEERSLIKFDKPADISGVKYLIWSYDGLEKEDDIWTYLPSESLLRRISGSSRYASFMRSDLANEDIQNYDDVEEYTYNLLGSEVVDGIDCYILERIPKPEKDTQYSKEKQWVRKDIWLRRKSEFYDKRDKLLKTAQYEKVENIDGIWTVTRMRLQTPAKRSETVIDWSELRYNVGLEDILFEHSRLKR